MDYFYWEYILEDSLSLMSLLLLYMYLFQQFTFSFELRKIDTTLNWP